MAGTKSPASGKMCLPHSNLRVGLKSARGLASDERWESYGEMGSPHLPAFNYHAATLEPDAWRPSRFTNCDEP